MKPTFSIVVPTLNEERFLPRLLNSLCEQNDRDFEVLIVDGASEDKTIAIAKRFGKKLPIRILQATKRGISYQRNLGAFQAKASWIVMTDADSLFYPHCITQLKFYLKAHPTISYAGSWFSPDSDSVNDAFIILMINAGIELSLKMKRPAGYGAFMLIKKSVFKEIGGFDEVHEFGEDNDLTRRLYQHTGQMMSVIREGLTTYSLRRYHKNGMAQTLQLYARVSFMLLLTKKTPAKISGYEMGGHVYTDKEKKERTTLLETYEKTLKKFMKDFMPSNTEDSVQSGKKKNIRE